MADTDSETVLEPAPKRKQPFQLGTHGIEPANKLLDIPWDEIKSLVESGQSMCKVAKQYAHHHTKGYDGLLEVIKKRAQRSMWVVPKTAMARARARLQEMGVQVPTPSQMALERSQRAESERERVGTALTLTLAEMGEEGSMIAGNLNLALLRKASKDPEKLAPLVDVKDIAVAAKTLRLVAGMDKQAPTVSLNLWGDPSRLRDIGGDKSGDMPEIRDWSDDE